MADILIEDQLRPPLDMVTVYQERELHKPKIIYLSMRSSAEGPDDTYHFASLLLLHWIEKRSNLEHRLEHLESKLMMRGRIIRQSW